MISRIGTNAETRTSADSRMMAMTIRITTRERP